MLSHAVWPARKVRKAEGALRMPCSPPPALHMNNMQSGQPTRIVISVSRYSPGGGDQMREQPSIKRARPGTD